MMFQLCIYIDRAFVSSSPGMASTFNYASNLFITISSVFIVAMSTVVFPSISKNYEEGRLDYVKDLVGYIINIMTAIFIPFILIVAFFGSDIIRLIYERGAFTSDSTSAVAVIFLMYTLSILGYTTQELFNKVLYLAGKYKYTVSGTVSIIILNVILNYVIKVTVPKGGSLAPEIMTAASTALLSTGYAVFIAFNMKEVIGSYISRQTATDIIKTLVSGAAAVLVYLLFGTFLPSFTHGYLTFIVPIAACGVVYIALLALTGVLEHIIKREKKGKQAENEENN